ncbi:glycosyltransferase family 4 protein [bacterium]|nr:glycosyltransferase family 4 protein [bacterium]
MKVAWLMPNLHVTGGARVAVELSDRMIARGHEFYILIPTGRYKLPYKLSAEVIECGIPVGNPLLAVLTGTLSMPKRVPAVDVVIGCMPPYALLAGRIARKRGIRAVNYLLHDDVHFFDDRSYIRSNLLLKIYRNRARRSIRSGANFVNSHWTAVRCVSEGGLKPFAIVPSGYNQEVFFPMESGKDNSDPVRIVTIGRHIRWKGFPDLIEALNLLDYKKLDFMLDVISQDDLNISEAQFPLSIHKPTDDRELVDLYRTGDIFVHSSWFEGFGVPPLEAQACGLAVISTDCGGVREFLLDGDNALMVPPREPRTMAHAVERLILNKDLRHRITKRGLETCVDFTWDRATDKFETALQKLIDS